MAGGPRRWWGKSLAVLAAVLMAGAASIQPFQVPMASAAPSALRAADAGPLPQHVAQGVHPGKPLGTAAVRAEGEAAPAPAKPHPTTSRSGKSGYDPATSTVASRSEYETVYRNTDGSDTAQFSIEPLNVQRSDGSWAPVNTTVTSAASGGYQVADNPLSPTFAAKSGGTGGDYSVTSDGFKVSFSLVGEKKQSAGKSSAAQRAVSGGSAASSVAYDGVAPGEDLAYQVLPGQVKETLVLDSVPTQAAPTYSWMVHAPGLTLGTDKYGDVTFTDASGNVVFITPIPAMEDSSGVSGQSEGAVTNVPVSLTQTTGSDWQMTLKPDPTWLDDPSRVYPVFLDPSTASTYADNAHAYESTGTLLTGVAYVGNSQAAGDTYWRTITHFNYEQLFGDQVLGVDLQEWYNGSGTLNATVGAVDYATVFSYYGVGAFLSPISIGAGSSGYGDATGSGLTTEIAGWVNARSSGNYLMLAGQENSGQYTYKDLGLEMFISYEAKPTIAATQVSVPDPNGFAATTSSPQGGQVGSATPTLTTTYTQDPSNGSAAVNRWYSVSANANMSSPLWQSGWTSDAQVQVPAGVLQPGTTYYWQAQVQDEYGATALTPVYSWKTSTNPTLNAGTVTPADNSVVATTTPTLSVPPSTSTNGQALTYAFRVASGIDGASGQVVLSPLISKLDPNGMISWPVPAGILQDGTAYTWDLLVNDGYDDWVPAVQRVSVNLRVTNPGPSPTDSAGPVSVNLANGNVSTSIDTPTVNTVGGPMGYQLTYNSQQTSNAGLIAHFYNLTGASPTFSYTSLPSQTALVQVNTVISQNWGTDSPAPGVNQTNFQAQWTGFVTPPVGTYNFGFTSDDGAELTLGTGPTLTPVITDQWTPHSAQASPKMETSAAQTLVVSSDGTATLGGKPIDYPVPVIVNYFQRYGAASINWYVQSTTAPNPQLVPTDWLTHTAPPLPDGWAASAPIAGDAAQYVALKNNGGSVAVTDSDGGTHTFTRTSSGGYTPPPGESETLATDSNGAMSLTGTDGTVYLFDATGKLTSATPPVDAGSKPATPIPTYVTTSSLDDALRSLADPLSNAGNAGSPSYQRAIYFAYKGEQYSDLGIPASAGINGTGPVCQTSSQWGSAPPGMLCAIVYPDGTTTQLEYTSTGQLGGVLTPGGAQTLLTYSTVHGGPVLTGVSTPTDTDWAAANNVATEPVTTIGYDASGGGTSVILPAVGSAPAPAKTYTYASSPTPTQDGTSFVDVAGLTPPASGPGHDTEVTFDTALRKTSSTTASGLTTRTLWNTHDNPLATLDANGHETSTVYDTQDRATASYGPAPASCFGATATSQFGPTTTDANGVTDGPVPAANCAAMNGTAVATSTTGYDDNLTGLSATYYNNLTLTGVPSGYGRVFTGTDAEQVWSAAPATGMGTTNWSASLAGLLSFTSAGTWTLSVTTDNTVQLYANDKLIINATAAGTYSTTVTTTTANQVMRLRAAYAHAAAASPAFRLAWTPPGGSSGYIPVGQLSADYGLATSTHAADSAPTGVVGVSGTQVPAANTSRAYVYPWFGTNVTTTTDPGGLGLSATATSESPGTGYLRQISTTKPAGVSTTTTTAYYGGTGNPNTSYGTALNTTAPICGLAVSTPQDGLTMSVTGPAPATGSQLVTKYVYDLMGRVAGTLLPGDTTWGCTYYDSRGRVQQQTYTDRTVNYTYSAGGYDNNKNSLGDPLTSTVSDPSGTITTVDNLDGETTSYAEKTPYPDATGAMTTTTTSAYNQAMQVTSATTTLPDGTGHTEAYAYNADGQQVSMSEDGNTIAQSTYTNGILTAVAYPSGAGNAGNGTSGSLTYGPPGAETGVAWQFAAGQTPISDTHVLSQSGRVLQDTVTDGAANYISTYGYDAAGRLVSASVPFNQLTYQYASSGGCGANAAAGMDGNRTGMTDTVTPPGSTTANPATTFTYCYDNADRLTSDNVTGAPANPDIIMGTNLSTAGATPNLIYDSHGNITQLATETLGYDDTNRHMSTTLADGTTVTYQRDAEDRIVSMTQTPAGGTATTVRYAYTDGGDASAFTLSGKAVQEQTLSLPGGGTVSIQAGKQVWSYPGLSGNDLVTTDATGARTGAVALYDPFGDPIDPTTGAIGTIAADTSGPGNTTTPSVSNGFEGQHGKGVLTLDGLATIEMGARQYVPLLGRFLSVDPIAGGNSNDYNYPNDSVNYSDLNGQKGGIAGACAGYRTRQARAGCNARTQRSVARVTRATNRKVARKIAYYRSHPRDLVIDGVTTVVGKLSSFTCAGITDGFGVIPCWAAGEGISRFLNDGLKGRRWW